MHSTICLVFSSTSPRWKPLPPCRRGVTPKCLSISAHIAADVFHCVSLRDAVPLHQTPIAPTVRRSSPSSVLVSVALGLQDSGVLQRKGSLGRLPCPFALLDLLGIHLLVLARICSSCCWSSTIAPSTRRRLTLHLWSKLLDPGRFESVTPWEATNFRLSRQRLLLVSLLGFLERNSRHRSRAGLGHANTSGRDSQVVRILLASPKHRCPSPCLRTPGPPSPAGCPQSSTRYPSSSSS
mmetsp:Transcript_11858/g.42413  ORF Transcript_11858/g.42413 Transcript_11858/m.42413 type:complete len:238 (-) Transcript_11858:351-1064(-)